MLLNEKMPEWRKSKQWPELDTLFRRCMDAINCCMSITDELGKPCQRLQKYPLFLRRLLKAHDKEKQQQQQQQLQTSMTSSNSLLTNVSSNENGAAQTQNSNSRRGSNNSSGNEELNPDENDDILKTSVSDISQVLENINLFMKIRFPINLLQLKTFYR